MRHVIVAASPWLAFLLRLVGLKIRFELSREDGGELTVDDLLSMDTIFRAWDADHGQPLPEEEAQTTYRQFMNAAGMLLPPEKPFADDDTASMN